MTVRRLLYFIFVPIVGFFAIFILPYNLSPQRPLITENLSGFYDQSQEQGVFHGQAVTSYYVPAPKQLLSVLGTSDSQKRIEIDLTQQRLFAFEGDQKIYDFLISSGKWGRTPTGLFHIWIKLRSTKMEGGNKALHTYYNLPNVPYVMFFANDEIPRWRGFGLHGTYWHSNFGTPMSHGCINMKTEDAEKLYYWTLPLLNGKPSVPATEENPGTPILIYGTAPLG